MSNYKHFETGKVISESDYDSLPHWKQDEYDETGDFITSAIIGAVTGSAILGGLLGGDIVGGILGDSLDGDLFD